MHTSVWAALCIMYYYSVLKLTSDKLALSEAYTRGTSSTALL
jgi:hypothetical protein